MKFELVAIDEHFFRTYFDEHLPYAKAADLVLLAMALKERRPLVTEDEGLYKAAKRAGVATYKTAEYLTRLGIS